MRWKLLYNPFAALGRGKGFLAAIVVIAALTAVAWWGGVHLDGALDLHVTPARPSAALIIGESLIDWLSLGLILLAASKLFDGNGGAGAHLAAAGLSRFPYILAAAIISRQVLGESMLSAVSIGQEQVILRPQELITPAMAIGALAIMALAAWSIVILYLGYKEASSLKAGRAAAAFVIGLLAAEAISKVLIVLLARTGL